MKQGCHFEPNVPWPTREELDKKSKDKQQEKQQKQHPIPIGPFDV